MSLAAGSTLGPYEILAPLGAGGMGEVYRARDPRLGREVAVKVLPADRLVDEGRRRRFVQEARAASTFSHPHIVTIYEIDSADGIDFIVMEYVSGLTLRELIPKGRMPVQDALRIAIPIADALAAAHARGVVHRDLKPANVIVSREGVVKVLDFGLAKFVIDESEDAGPTQTTASVSAALSRSGAVMGTAGYMSPEQATGGKADARSDVFSFGTLLYEMVTGLRAFAGQTASETLTAVVRDQPKSPRELVSSVPEPLERLILRCLRKEADRRFQHMADVKVELQEIKDETDSAASVAPGTPLRRRRAAWIVAEARPARWRPAALVLGAAVVVIGTAAGWLWHRVSRERWALETATPEIARLIEVQEYAKAAALTREARAVLPKDATLEKLWMRATVEASIRSEPRGADVFVRPYRGDANAWEALGKTPIERLRVPRQEYLFRVAKPGFDPAHFIDSCIAALQPGVPRCSIDWTLKLRPEGSVPPDMVGVSGGEIGLGYPTDKAPSVQLDDYLIDRHEVTNEEYQKFVDGGGYQKRELWKQPFAKDGRTIPWEKAVALFKDATGRPGPATWEVGRYPKGLGAHPVAGVSWYEAVAYAEFAGKSLPTAYHWTAASQSGFAALIASGSNFRGARTQPVGSPGAVSGFGTSDMAGNVKEWAWNEFRDGKRFILGGGFGEPNYMFVQTDAQLPWERRPNYGFRCVKLDSSPSAAATAKIEASSRDISKQKPVSDDVFNAYRGLYAYDKRELNTKVEEAATTDTWTREKVSFDAAYGNERVIAHVFLPKVVAPPFQAVVYFPGAFALLDDRFAPSVIEEGLDFLLRSGRALIFPIYKSTYERRDGYTPSGMPPGVRRDHALMWSKDLSRTLDYLETRRDIDSQKLAYLGFSWGGHIAPILLAVETRFKAAILSSGGFPPFDNPPEIDRANFAPRVRVPVLMLNGRYDDYYPLESAQLPLFRLLGTMDKDKKHVIYEAGHGDLPHKEEVRESLDWLDKYLGPVRR